MTETTKQLMMQMYLLSLDPKREDYSEQVERAKNIMNNMEHEEEHE